LRGGTITASPATGSVFISYRRGDTQYQAGWLYEVLVKHLGRSRVFKDIDSIEPGDDFAEVINTAVASCDVLLALIGTRWLTITKDGRRRLDDPGDFVRLEIETALSRSVLVIPILLDGVEMPPRQELPASLAKLAGLQAHTLPADHFMAGTKRLLRRLDETLARASRLRTDVNPESMPTPAPRQPGRPPATPVAAVGRPAPERPAEEDAIRQLARRQSDLSALLSAVDDDASRLDSNSYQAHELVEEIHRALSHDVYGPGNLLNSSAYRESRDELQGVFAAENDMYELYTHALEHYRRRQPMNLGVAESDSDRLALVERRRAYIPKLMAVRPPVQAILDHLAEKTAGI
jgi:hypothetical protein